MEDLCDIVGSKFVNFSSEAHGGALCLKQTISLQVFFCTFFRCVTVQSCHGGGIYVQSSKSIVACRNCIYECSAGYGHFMYVNGVSNPNVFINETMNTKCYGDHSVYFSYAATLCSRIYNSSYCSAKIHGNLGTHITSKTDSAFQQYFNNSIDIVYSIYAGGENHKLSHVCLITNGRSRGRDGYIHTNSPSSVGLTVNYLYAYGNDPAVTIVQPLVGSSMIVVNNFTGDVFNYCGNGRISTSNIIKTGVVMTTLFKDILVCEKITECMFLTNRKESYISLYCLIIHILA
jgi:hypothetical protein